MMKISRIRNQKYSPHLPVMLREMLEYLSPQNGQNFLDCTFGAGGYSKAILDSCKCNLVAFDRDPMTEVYAKELEKVYGNRFEFIRTKFSDIPSQIESKKFDSIVLDLGVSSMQLDIAERGFSFSQEASLDMRMSNEGFSASDFINSATEEEIANIIYKYGDEHDSRKIAKKIIFERKIESILTTIRLANIIRGVKGFKKGKIDPATKTFQAIRIHINDEVGEIERFLDNLKNILAINGKIIIVSFHSIEDSIVKYFFKENAIKHVARSKYSKEIIEKEEGKWLKILTKKAIFPSREEILSNPRSRSARLRAAIKIGLNYDD